MENARRVSPRLTCEVNSTPPNPKSIVFHKAFGFSCVGTQLTEGGEKAVKLFALDPHPFN
jgi:predicted GNAT superfamily acetyltransferase